MPLPPRPWYRQAWTALLDLVYPRQCGGCRRVGSWLCAECLEQIAPPVEPGWLCGVCRGPLLAGPRGLYCPDLCAPTGLTATLCAASYAGPLRSAIHHLKYGSWRTLGEPLAALLEAACLADACPWPAEARPYLAPVPLHPRRRRRRGFNQSALLAGSLGERTGWPVLPGLTRVRDTPQQAQLSLGDRLVNLEDAFAWRGATRPPRGPIVLVDDVFTTGATMTACAEVLRDAGAEAVYGLALAQRAGEASASGLAVAQGAGEGSA
jgi:ComF family protein